MQNRYLYKIIGLFLFFSNISYAASLNLILEKGCQGCSVLSLDWFLSSGNNYLASGGEDQTNNKQIHVALFDASQGTLVNKATASFGSSNDVIKALDEITIDDKTFIAAGGQTGSNNNQIVIYEFTGNKLKNRRMTTVHATVNTVQWLTVNDDDYYLAVGSNEAGSELRIYYFNPEDYHLTLLDDTVQNFFNGAVNSVDWLTYNGNYYLAVGGFETASIPNEIRIYQFDPELNSLTLSSSSSFFGNTVNNLKWFEDSGILYLATVGNDSVGTSQIRIFTFDTTSDTLSLLTSASFNNNSIAYAVDWLNFGGTIYLAVGGNSGVSENGVQVFTFDGSTLTLAASVYDSNAEVRTVQWNVINSDAYLAAGTTFKHPIRIFQLIVT